MQVLETGFLTGELAATADNLDYFYDLRALYHEGRYDTLLIQIDHLNSTHAPDANGDDNDAVSLPDKQHPHQNESS